jgi:hypothetical protein
MIPRLDQASAQIHRTRATSPPRPARQPNIRRRRSTTDRRRRG